MRSVRIIQGKKIHEWYPSLGLIFDKQKAKLGDKRGIRAKNEKRLEAKRNTQAEDKLGDKLKNLREVGNKWRRTRRQVGDTWETNQRQVKNANGKSPDKWKTNPKVL